MTSLYGGRFSTSLLSAGTSQQFLVNSKILPDRWISRVSPRHTMTALAPPMSYSFISPQNQIIRTKTIKEFSDQYSVSYRSARALASGFRSKIKGWCSTSPKAKRARKRFTTRLVNTKTGRIEIVGQSAKSCAKRMGVCYNDLVKLLNGHKIMIRGWAMEQTMKLAQSHC